MDVAIHGQTISNFNVTVTDASGAARMFDIAAELVVSDDLDLEVRDAAAKEHFFHQLAIDAEAEQADFEKTFYDPYLAHTEKYARYYLKGSGEKNPTGTAKEKCAALLFGVEVDETAEAAVAYIGYKEEMGKIGIKPVTEVEFAAQMYRYDNMVSIERLHLALKHKTAQLRAVSSAFNTKSWSVKTAAADRRAMMGANIA